MKGSSESAGSRRELWRRRKKKKGNEFPGTCLLNIRSRLPVRTTGCPGVTVLATAPGVLSEKHDAGRVQKEKERWAGMLVSFAL